MATSRSYYGANIIYDKLDDTLTKNRVLLGNVDANAIYWGNYLVWRKPGEPIPEYLYYGGMTSFEINSFVPE